MCRFSVFVLLFVFYTFGKLAISQNVILVLIICYNIGVMRHFLILMYVIMSVMIVFDFVCVLAIFFG